MISTMAASKQGGAGREGWALVWLFVAGIVLLLVGSAVSLFAGKASSTSSGQLAPWRENLGFAVVVLAGALMVIGLVRMVRAQMFTTARRERARSLSTGQRRQMVRWVRQGEAAPQEMAQATTVTAESLALQRKGTLLYVGFTLMSVGITLGLTSLWWLASTAVLAVVMAVAVVLIRRDADLAQRWLDIHQQPAAAAPPAASR